jgi:hypothetical protein
VSERLPSLLLKPVACERPFDIQAPVRGAAAVDIVHSPDCDDCFEYLQHLSAAMPEFTVWSS